MLNKFHQLTNIHNNKPSLNLHTASVISAKLQLLQDLINIYKEYKISNIIKKHKVVIIKVKYILDRLMEEEFRITKQEISDIRLETTRIIRTTQLWKIEKEYAFRQSKQNKQIKKMHEEITSELFGLTKYSEETDAGMKKLLKQLNMKIHSAHNIIEIERKQIVKAIGLKQGHWFKCPKGHIYVITECGGAMQVGKCNECGERIGGMNHQVVPGNSLAYEMDGARYPAWSDAANMANYQIDD